MCILVINDDNKYGGLKSIYSKLSSKRFEVGFSQPLAQDICHTEKSSYRWINIATQKPFNRKNLKWIDSGQGQRYGERNRTTAQTEGG